MSAVGIAAQRLQHHQERTREALPHVRVAFHQPDARIARDRDYRRDSALTTRANAAASTSAPTTVKVGAQIDLRLRPPLFSSFERDDDWNGRESAVNLT